MMEVEWRMLEDALLTLPMSSRSEPESSMAFLHSASVRSAI